MSTTDTPNPFMSIIVSSIAPDPQSPWEEGDGEERLPTRRGTLEGVTGNVLDRGGYVVPPAALPLTGDSETVAKAAVWLDTASLLELDSTPSNPEARALVESLTERVAALPGTRRGPKLRAKLAQAIGAIVGGVLKNWARSEPRPVFRSAKAADFSDSPVPYRQFTAAMAALTKLGVIVSRQGYRREALTWGNVQTWSGKAARFWPSAALLQLAAEHGVTADTVKEQFRSPPPTKVPTVHKPLVVTTLKQVVGRRSGQGVKRNLDEAALGPDRERLRRIVEEANAFTAEHDIQGCLPPRWKRVFTENALLGGRWIALGKEGVYQTMPEAERLARITINGEPVAEVDVQASHLSIMHGLLALPLPDDDLYGFPGVPRAVAKAWITATLGKGSPVTKWSARATANDPGLHDHNPKQVGGIICRRYPFLRNPAEAVAKAAGLHRLSHVGLPQKLLTHRLMAIEAQALTGAMGYLRARGILALPMHDGLLVPVSGVRHGPGGLVGAYAWAANDVRIRCTVETAPDVARA